MFRDVFLPILDSHCNFLLPSFGDIANFFLPPVMLLCSISASACEQPTIVAPQQHQYVDSGRPVISWLPPATATGYEINIQSRIPEGEVITQFTSATSDTQFFPPAALSRDRAVVTVKVKARCGTSGVSTESERVFFVDVRSMCPLPSQVSRKKLGGFIKIAWEPNPQYDEVEVRAFGSLTTGPLERVRAQSFAMLPHDTDSPTVIGIRGICREANSHWQWLSADK